MRTSDAGIALLKKFEGCILKAYKLPGEAYYTIGYGHSFDTSITKDTVWTKAKAEEVLRQDLVRFERYVEADAPASLNQHQFDALVSYTYNRGRGGLRQLVSACKDLADYPDNIVKYWGSATRYKTGLINRRKAERELWLTPVEGNPHTTGHRTLRRGCQGDDVAWLQWELSKRGYALADDGDFGPNTERKVISFQSANNLTADGIVGPKTYGKLV